MVDDIPIIHMAGMFPSTVGMQWMTWLVCVTLLPVVVTHLAFA